MTDHEKAVSSSELVAKLIKQPDDGVMQNKLLERMFSDSDLASLEPLLAPGTPEPALRAGLFVLSELGERARPAVALIRPLFSIGSPSIRLRLVEILQATEAHSEVDLDFLLTCLESEVVAVVRAAAKALLAFSYAEVVARSANRPCGTLLANPEPATSQPASQFVVALGLLLRGDTEGARRIGDDSVGPALVRALELGRRISKRRS